MNATLAPPDPFAGLLPDPDTIRKRIDACEETANLLRRLLRLTIRCREEAPRLAGTGRPGGSDHAA